MRKDYFKISLILNKNKFELLQVKFCKVKCHVFTWKIKFVKNIGQDRRCKGIDVLKSLICIYNSTHGDQ